MLNLVGQTYKFEDGDSITVIQIKKRDMDTYWVTYHIQQGPGIARKLVTTYDKFISDYGHLFGILPEGDPNIKSSDKGD